ncbi:MAG: hypothetical protein KDJ29_08280, partial [Hyphomicrobiales bacterium]|nr:hypothetical protein [Hyphomicrobiales bacterium]
MNRSKDIASMEPQEWFARPARAEASEAPRETRIFDISDFIALIQRGRKTILITVAATTLAALAFGILSSKKYTAATELFIDSRGYRVLANDVRRTSDGNLSLVAEYETELQIITSGEVLSRVVQKEKLTSNSVMMPRPGLLSTLLNLIPRPKSSEKPDLALDARRILERMVTVKRSERSFIATILVTSPDRRLSARLAEAIAETYLEIHSQNRQRLTRRL